MAKIKLNASLALYTNDGANAVANSASRKLIISTHGGWDDSMGRISPSEVGNVTISFYSNENFSVSGSLKRAVKGQIQTIDTPIGLVKNYELSRFEHDPAKAELEPELTDDFDVLKVRTSWFGERHVSLKTAIQTVLAKGYKYSEVCCLFCRYTGSEGLSQKARPRTNAENNRLEMIGKQGALVRELKARQNV